MSEAKLGFTHENPTNKSVEWYTPPSIFEMLGLTFDLDPCHPESVLPWIPVRKTYNALDNGLKQDWKGLVWCNPPYGKFTAEWLKRMHEHRDGIALVFARTDCKWYHDYVAKADAVLFLKGRIRFVDGLGATGNSGAGCGSMLVAWGKPALDALTRTHQEGHLVVINQYPDLI